VADNVVVAAVRDWIDTRRLVFADDAAGMLVSRAIQAPAQPSHVFLLSQRFPKDIPRRKGKSTVKIARATTQIVLRRLRVHAREPYQREDVEAVLAELCPIWPFC
jgi:hypothetical protein